MSALKDETGNTYGNLKVIGRAENNKNGRAKWTCQCSCGNIIEVLGVTLRNGATQSCGCLQKKRAAEANTLLETGKRYGKLTVIARSGSVNGYATWRCKCDCGKEIVVRGVSLRSGNTLSCGLCFPSRGEQKICDILLAHQINFLQQYKLDGCKSIYHLPFDFAIFDKNNDLLCLIEYQGRQHYEKSFVFDDNEETLEYRQYKDQIKREFCNQNNIRLIEIPYTDFEKINWEYMEERIYGKKSY